MLLSTKVLVRFLVARFEHKTEQKMTGCQPISSFFELEAADAKKLRRLLLRPCCHRKELHTVSFLSAQDRKDEVAPSFTDTA